MSDDDDYGAASWKLKSQVATGATTYDVMFVQETLRTERLYRGPVDGVAGAKTRMALKKYKRRHGLPVDDSISAEFLTQVRDAI